MNAVILAAGVGHRMINLTRQLNKTLLPVGGVPIIERSIRLLKEAGIHEIVIVTGHKHELFLPLVEKYNVKLIQNKKYSIYNNLYSLQLALEYIENTFLICGDVVLFKNLFMNKPATTTIYTIYKNPKGVPTLEVYGDHNRMLSQVKLSRANESITTSLGIGYIGKEEAKLIKEYYHNSVTDKKMREYKGEFETELLPLFIQNKVDVHHVDHRYAMDINLMDEYYQACIKYETYWKGEGQK